MQPLDTATYLVISPFLLLFLFCFCLFYFILFLGSLNWMSSGYRWDRKNGVVGLVNPFDFITGRSGPVPGFADLTGVVNEC